MDQNTWSAKAAWFYCIEFNCSNQTEERYNNILKKSRGWKKKATDFAAKKLILIFNRKEILFPSRLAVAGEATYIPTNKKSNQILNKRNMIVQNIFFTKMNLTPRVNFTFYTVHAQSNS